MSDNLWVVRRDDGRFFGMSCNPGSPHGCSWFSDGDLMGVHHFDSQKEAANATLDLSSKFGGRSFEAVRLSMLRRMQMKNSDDNREWLVQNGDGKFLGKYSHGMNEWHIDPDGDVRVFVSQEIALEEVERINRLSLGGPVRAIRRCSARDSIEQAKARVATEASNASASSPKDDDGKLRFDLLPSEAEAELVAVLTYGAVKYSPNGWKTVPEARDRYFAALRRHLSERRMGRLVDAETGLPTLAHALCDLTFLLQLDLEEAAREGALAPLEERLAKALEVARELRARREAKPPAKVVAAQEAFAKRIDDARLPPPNGGP